MCAKLIMSLGIGCLPRLVCNSWPHSSRTAQEHLPGNTTPTWVILYKQHTTYSSSTPVEAGFSSQWLVFFILTPGRLLASLPPGLFPFSF